MKFLDAQGREWLVRIDCNAVERIELGTSINFGDWTEVGSHLNRLLFDDLFVARVAYYVLQPEIDKRKLSREDFMIGLIGDATGKACDAIQQGFTAFFRDPVVRATVKENLDEAKKKVETLLDSGKSSTGLPANSESTPAHSLLES